VEAEPITGLSHRFNFIEIPDVPFLLRAMESAVNRVRRPWKLHRVLRRIEIPIRTVVLELRSVWRAWRWLRGADLLLAAGGGQIDDIWGGAWGHPYALARWAWLSRRAGVPFVMLSLGFGQARSRLSRAFLRYAVRQARYCSLRDEGSRTLTAALGAGTTLHLVPDLAFGLHKAAGARDDGPALAIGISPMSFRRHNWPDADVRRYEAFVALWAATVADRVARGDRVRLFATNPSDEPAVDDVWALLDAPTQAKCERERVTSVAELLGLYAHLDLVVATRLHGVLLALVAERPAVALSYERKVRTLMTDSGLSEYCLDLETANRQEVSSTISALAERRAAVEAAIAARVEMWRGEVERQADALATIIGGGA
jgi:polysaccharide pyruvyl transferase WcaK-like protein